MVVLLLLLTLGEHAPSLVHRPQLHEHLLSSARLVVAGALPQPPQQHGLLLLLLLQLVVVWRWRGGADDAAGTGDARASDCGGVYGGDYRGCG